MQFQEDLIKTYKVQKCEDVLELKTLLTEFDKIMGSRTEYTSKVIIHRIDELDLLLQNGDTFDDLWWNLITRTYGLRAKVMELLYYKKHNI